MTFIEAYGPGDTAAILEVLRAHPAFDYTYSGDTCEKCGRIFGGGWGCMDKDYEHRTMTCVPCYRVKQGRPLAEAVQAMSGRLLEEARERGRKTGIPNPEHERRLDEWDKLIRSTT